VNGLAAVALKEDFSAAHKLVSYLWDKATQLSEGHTPMKFATIAIAAAVALSSTAAFAQPRHRSSIRADRNMAPMVQLHPNYGNPNGNPDGPTTLSGTGNSAFGGSVAGTSGYN
jgi:hypothetical protein